MAFLVSLSLLGLQIWVTSQLSTVLITLFSCCYFYVFTRWTLCIHLCWFYFSCVILWLVSCAQSSSLFPGMSLLGWLMRCGCWVSLHQRCVKGASRKHRIVPSSSPAASVYWQNLNLSIWLIASHFKAKIFSKISIQHVCAVHKEARRVSDPLQL